MTLGSYTFISLSLDFFFFKAGKMCILVLQGWEGELIHNYREQSIRTRRAGQLLQGKGKQPPSIACHSDNPKTSTFFGLKHNRSQPPFDQLVATFWSEQNSRGVRV